MGSSAPIFPSETGTAAAETVWRGVAAPPRGLWYLAMPGAQLKRGKTVHRTLLDEPVLIGRDRSGNVFAMRDICPHRAMPLSAGRFDGEEVTCAYHGWRFGADGVCRGIPSLVEDYEKTVRIDRIKVKNYPCREVQHLIWIYMGDDAGSGDDDLPPIPEMPVRGRPGIAETLDQRPGMPFRRRRHRPDRSGSRRLCPPQLVVAVVEDAEGKGEALCTVGPRFHHGAPHAERQQPDHPHVARRENG